MALQSIIKSGGTKRLILLAGALLMAALVTIPASNVALAQTPPGAYVTLVNEGEDFIERKGDGRFIARPLFDRELDVLYYGVRNPDTGQWLAGMYRVQGGEKERRDGWEYSFEYPFQDGQPELDRDQPYLLVILVTDPGGGDPHTFYGVIPPHEPGGIWNKVLRALDPGRWAKAFATWIIEGVHGTLCGVAEQATGEDAEPCRGA